MTNKGRKVAITAEELEVTLKNLAPMKEWQTLHNLFEGMREVKMNDVFANILEQRAEDRMKGEISMLNYFNNLYEKSKSLLNKTEEERRG